MPGGTGIRVDTAAYAEGVIPPYYDSLIAKLVVRGRDRDEAIARMSRALEMFVVEGIYTTHSAAPADHGRSRFPRRKLRHQVHGTLPGQWLRKVEERFTTESTELRMFVRRFPLVPLCLCGESILYELE